MRDTSQGEQCRYYENPLDWNQTGPTGQRGPTGPTGPGGVALLLRSVFTGLTRGEYGISESCGSFGIADPVYAHSSFGPAYTQRENDNDGMVATGVPNNSATMIFNLSSTVDVTVTGSCVDPTAYGLARPNTPPTGTPKFTLTKIG